MTKKNWVSPPRDLPFGTAEAHLWLHKLSDPYPNEHSLFPLLSSREQEQADRFRREQDRKKYIIFHAIVRLVLAQYEQVEPHTLTIERGIHGKPYVSSPHIRGLTFNLSHSGDCLLLGVCCDGEIGVDIEMISPFSDTGSIVDRYFSPSEALLFQQLPSDARDLSFFRCWTRKEAILKALGTGLRSPLDGFSVPMTFHEIESQQIAFSGADATSWILNDLTVPMDNYVAAMATSFLVQSACYYVADLPHLVTGF